MSPVALIVLGALVLVLVIVALAAIRVVQQYERGVIFVLGRLIGAKGPGIFLVPPFISRMMKVDLRIVTLTVPPQEVITRDNVTIKVTAVIYFYVVDPIAAVVKVVNFNSLISRKSCCGSGATARPGSPGGSGRCSPSSAGMHLVRMRASTYRPPAPSPTQH